MNTLGARLHQLAIDIFRQYVTTSTSLAPPTRGSFDNLTATDLMEALRLRDKFQGNDTIVYSHSTKAEFIEGRETDERVRVGPRKFLIQSSIADRRKLARPDPRLRVGLTSEPFTHP